MRIMFFMDWPLAITYLRPIYDHFRSVEPEWELFFASFDSTALSVAIAAGLPVSAVRTDYDVAFCCDGWSACPARDRIVTFHGLASKGAELSSQRAGRYDGVFIAPSDYFRDILVHKMGVPEERIIRGGLTKFDTVRFIPQLRKKPKVLFAPTHNVETSAIPVLQDRIYELDDVTVHLHMWTRTGEKDIAREYRGYYPTRNDTEDITDLMLAADIVIADMGSTVLEAMALGRMAIQVVNPRWEELYLARDIGAEELATLPEIALPRRFAFEAGSMDEVLDIVGRYPDFPRPDFSLVDNVGKYRVSKILHEYVKERGVAR